MDLIRDNLTRGNAARRLLVDVAAMREAQRSYFKLKTSEKLHQAKELEKKVDAALEELRRK